ncbi:DUF2330 domain-containing protein [Streptomyces acidiscabies]|uniref:DUF2330 domain-containing protein n=1 Tax=Streptomyces acidiscabies TaxID=42234 RepID=UPI0038F728CD
MVVGFPWRRPEAAKGSFTSLRARALTVLLLPAVLLPVAPAYAVPARASVELGDPTLLDQPAAATVPSYRARQHFWPQDSAWLRAGGFALPAGLQDALRPYVAPRRQYVAIKPAPAAHGALRGALDPLHVTFVRLASTPVSLSPYVLAAHRMEPVSAVGDSRPRVTYAGRVPAVSLETPYLPAPVTTDPELRHAASDTPVRQVVHADRLRALAGIPAWLLTVTAVILALAATAIHLAVRGNRARTGTRRRGLLTTSPEGSTPAMTGTTEEPSLTGITARVADALAALRARVGGSAGGIPPMPKEAPTVGGPAEPGAGGIPPMPRTAPAEGPRWPEAAPARGDTPIPADGIPPLPGRAPTGGFSPAPEATPPGGVAPGNGIPPMPRTAPAVGADFAVGGAASAGSPWWPEQAPGRGGASAPYADGVPVLPEEAPATAIPPRPRTAPTGGPDGASWGDVTERTSGAGVPPFPEMPPAGGVPPVAEDVSAGGGHGVYDAPPVPRCAPRVPPMPSVPPYAPPAPTTDGGTAHLFVSPGDAPRVGASAGLHKYPFCAPPLNQNTFGTRHKHRRVQQVPRQGR